MGYPTKVQLIRRKRGPTAVAEAMDFEKSEVVHWHVEDKANLVLHRSTVPPSPVEVKKNGKNHC